MDFINASSGPNFERLDRPKGRPVREKLASARVTADELKELDVAAALGGKLFGEWAREVLLKAARGVETDPAFTEIIAMRRLLNGVLRYVACGEKMTPEAFNAEMQEIRTTKHKAADEIMQQYATTGKSR